MKTCWFAAFGVLATVAPADAHAQDVDAAAKIIDIFRPGGLVNAAIVIAIAILLLRFVGMTTRHLGERFAEHRLLAHQVSTLFRFGIYILAFTLVIRSVFILDRESMLALTGTIAVSVGFALKDLAASVLAGITLVFDRPFQVGDRVAFAGEYGEITSIGLRSVRLITLDDSEVTIPNNRFLTDVVKSGNAGSLDMQIAVDFFVALDANLNEAKRIVYEAVRTSAYVYLKKPVVVLINDLIHEGYLATRLRAKAYVVDVRYEKDFETDVTERVKQGFAQMGIPAPRGRLELLGPTTPKRSALDMVPMTADAPQ